MPNLLRGPKARTLMLAALISAPALADPLRLPQVTNAGGANVPSVASVCTNVDGTACTDGLPAASSTPIIQDVTSAAILGPLAPQLGRDVRIIITPTTISGSWAGSVQVGTSSTASACAAGTISNLTVGGQTWGNFTANANEVVDTPTLASIVYCVSASITSGSAHIVLRQ